ncbi:MAG: hypothetical protein ACE1Y1_06905, partial [Nitrosomonadaceae bacterium]
VALVVPSCAHSVGDSQHGSRALVVWQRISRHSPSMAQAVEESMAQAPTVKRGTLTDCNLPGEIPPAAC